MHFDILKALTEKILTSVKMLSSSGSEEACKWPGILDGSSLRRHGQALGWCTL